MALVSELPDQPFNPNSNPGLTCLVHCAICTTNVWVNCQHGGQIIITLKTADGLTKQWSLQHGAALDSHGKQGVGTSRDHNEQSARDEFEIEDFDDGHIEEGDDKVERFEQINPCADVESSAEWSANSEEKKLKGRPKASLSVVSEEDSHGGQGVGTSSHHYEQSTGDGIKIEVFDDGYIEGDKVECFEQINPCADVESSAKPRAYSEKRQLKGRPKASLSVESEEDSPGIKGVGTSSDHNEQSTGDEIETEDIDDGHIGGDKRVECFEQINPCADVESSAKPRANSEKKRSKRRPKASLSTESEVVKSHNNASDQNKKGKHQSWLKPHQCEICGHAFINKRDLEQHTNSHFGLKPFMCDTCGKGFSCSTNLKRHERGHTGDKRFECDYCGKKFLQKINMQSHRRLHTGEKPFCCEICGKQFREAAGIRNHRKTHQPDEKPGTRRTHVCEICGRSYSHPSGLHSHIKFFHQNLRPCECSVCGEKFRTKQSLANHEAAIHRGEKPFSCSICDKMFSCEGNKNRHELIHSENPIMHECHICEKTFTHVQYLKAHLKTHRTKSAGSAKTHRKKSAGSATSSSSNDQYYRDLVERFFKE